MIKYVILLLLQSKSMKKYVLFSLFGIGAAMLWASCGGNTQPAATTSKSTDTRTSGSINIAVDESYKPVITQEVNVFDSSYPNAKINPSYLPESECFAQLFSGKVQMIMTTRELSPEEIKSCESRNIYTRSVAIAQDAIVIVGHKGTQDSLMTVGQLKAILTGGFARKYTVVVDNKNGSIARYITDVLIPGQKLSAQLFAANNSEEVIQYVAKTPDAIGLIGMSHAFDPESNVGYGTFRSDVKVVSLQNDTLQRFIKPYQASVALKEYPMVRKLYFIVRQDSELGAGFANFLTSEPGQMIIGKAMMQPLQVQLIIREAEIKP
jgi:phosphate transport system substrate-binding protein